MFQLNIKPAACTFALVTTSTLAFLNTSAFAKFTFHVDAATNNKDIYDWYSAPDNTFNIPANNNFDIIVTSDTALDQSVASIDFTLTYNPVVVSTAGFVVNAHTTPFNFSDVASSTGTPDDTITFTLRPTAGSTWDPSDLRLADLTFRGHTRNDSVSSDIALLIVTPRDQFGNALAVSIPNPSDAARFFIVSSPEPASCALLGVAAAPLLVRRRRN